MHNYKEEAKKTLWLLRAGTTHPEAYVSWLRDQLDRGDLTLADIGTDENELKTFTAPKK